MSDTTVPAAPAAAPPRRGVFRRCIRFCTRATLFTVGPLAIAAIGAWMYLSGGRHISTENAYIKADTVAISTDIDGRVSSVHVREHQRVKRGALLFEIDPRPFQIALANAEARLGVVRNEVEGFRRTYRQRVQELELARSDLEFARRDYDRQKKLSSTGIVARSAHDDALRKRQRAERTIPALREAVAATLANLGGNPELPVEEHPSYQQAITDRNQALLDLEYTKLHSPVGGVVSNLRLQAGEYLEAGDAAFGIVSSESLFITANLKETQLTHISVGQLADVRVDAYPGLKWRATVDSISPATGSEFSVLPAQNATGNWVKVVQRLPVRLRIDDLVEGNVKPPPALRAGMSLEVSIDTGHKRPVPPAVLDGYAAISEWLAPHLESIAGWLKFQAYADAANAKG